MSKKSRRGAQGRTGVADRPTGHLSPDDVPVVGGREPCPCGSGKRYKACHGLESRQDAARLVTKPFDGLPGECDWVALREIVPAATAQVRILADAAGRATDATVATVLPMAWAAMHRGNGAVFVGLQTAVGSSDPSRDVAHALLGALAADPGTPVPAVSDPGPGPRLQDLLDTTMPFVVSVHEGFDFWLDGDDVTPDVRESMERANNAAVPTLRLASVEAAYWCRVGVRRHLRWVLPDAEDTLLDGLARLHAAGATSLLPGSRYIGAFRAHGLVVPVWDLAADTEADALEAPAAAFAKRLGEAVATQAPLTLDERRARDGVVSRQLTLR